MHIVLDAMGSDHAPSSDVAGALLAIQETQYYITLVGNEPCIRQELGRTSIPDRLRIIHAEQHITMDDKPSIVGRGKPQSSMHVGMNMVKSGEADAFVTAGNTGAVQVIAMLHTLRRIQGVKRPALSAIFPIHGKPVIFLDIGANADSKPEWLVQFALMGDIYARKALGLSSPRIGLLSNGEEQGKGSTSVTQAGQILQSMMDNYVGNIEPQAMLEGAVDVLVTDGFMGNVLLKTFEASTRYLTGLIRTEIRRDPLSSLGGLLARPAFNRVRQHIDTSEIGGAPLLGVNGVVIIAHGGSEPQGLKNAIVQAAKAVEGGIVTEIREGLTRLVISEAD